MSILLCVLIGLLCLVLVGDMLVRSTGANTGRLGKILELVAVVLAAGVVVVGLLLAIT